MLVDEIGQFTAVGSQVSRCTEVQMAVHSMPQAPAIFQPPYGNQILQPQLPLDPQVQFHPAPTHPILQPQPSVDSQGSFQSSPIHPVLHSQPSLDSQASFQSLHSTISLDTAPSLEYMPQSSYATVPPPPQPSRQNSTTQVMGQTPFVRQPLSAQPLGQSEAQVPSLYWNPLLPPNMLYPAVFPGNNGSSSGTEMLTIPLSQETTTWLPATPTGPSMGDQPQFGEYSSGQPSFNPVELPKQKCCSICNTTETPTWRRHQYTGACVCNACGLYYKLHKKNREFIVNSRGNRVVRRQPRRSGKIPPKSDPANIFSLVPCTMPASTAENIAANTVFANYDALVAGSAAFTANVSALSTFPDPHAALRDVPYDPHMHNSPTRPQNGGGQV